MAIVDWEEVKRREKIPGEYSTREDAERIYRDAEMQRRVRILTYLGRKDIPESGKRRVITRTITPMVRPEPRQETITTVIPSGDEKYTIGAYQQVTSLQYQKALGSYKELDVTKDYIISGHLFPGELVKPAYYKAFVEPARTQFESSLELKPYHKVRRTETGFEIREEKAKYEWERLGIWEKAGKALWVGTTQWPRTITEGITSIITREPPSKRGYAESLIEWEMGTWEIAKRKDYGGIAREALLSPAMTHVVYPIAGGAAIGAGVGAVTAVSATGGKILGVGIAGYSIYGITRSAIDDPVGTISTGVFTAPFSYLGYRQGYTYGFGRAEEFLYLRRTYGYGTPGYLRAKSILKTARQVQYVKAPRGKFDILRDVEKMDIGSARAMELFMMKYKGKFTLAGSGATRGQLGGDTRLGRDIDIFMKKGKYVEGAYGFLRRQGADISRFDIHGPDMYKPGRYHMFGFVEKKGVTLDIYSGGRYLGRAKGISIGEQAFRKAVAVSRLERQYRWGDYPGVYRSPDLPGFVKGPKDIADVVNISRSLISRTTKSLNPFTRISGRSAELSLSSFFDPSKYARFPLFKTFVADVTATQPLLPIGKPLSPMVIPSYPTGRTIYPIVDIIPPSVGIAPVPSYTIPFVPRSTMIHVAPSKILSVVPPSDIGPSLLYPSTYEQPYVPLVYTAPYTTPYREQVKPPSAPPYYKKPYSPPYYGPPYKPPPYYSPPYSPPYETLPPLPPAPPTKKPPMQPPIMEGKKPKLSREGYDVYVKDRFIVSGKKKYTERFIKLTKKPMSKQDALSFGAELVDQSAAASFKIVKAPTPPGQKGIRTYPPPISIRRWGSLSHMFYEQAPGKRKTGIPVFIERTDYRINTPGEIQGISARGWLAQRMGKRRRPRKKKNSKYYGSGLF